MSVTASWTRALISLQLRQLPSRVRAQETEAQSEDSVSWNCESRVFLCDVEFTIRPLLRGTCNPDIVFSLPNNRSYPPDICPLAPIGFISPLSGY
jgi:hypothetical protein